MTEDNSGPLEDDSARAEDNSVLADDNSPLDDPYASTLERARYRFRYWRHTRPFWGGLLVLIGATEILLSEKAPLPLVVHIGLQGLAGYLVPAVLFLCGLLLLFHPVQHTFYSILAVLLALGSWITSNLGGFFIGMLLGVIGGSLAFAWTRGAERAAAPPPPPRPKPGEPSSGLEIFEPGESVGRHRAPEDGAPGAGAPQDRVPEDDDTRQIRMEPGGPGEHGGGHHGRAFRAGPLAVALLAAAQPASVPGLLAPALSAASRPPATDPGRTLLGLASSPSSTPTPTSTPSGSASPSPSPSASTSPSASVTPTGSPSSSASPSPSPSPTPSPHPSRSPRPHVKHASARRARPAAAVSSISSGSASMTGLVFDGVARVRTSRGRVRMLKFSMATLTFADGAALTYSIHGRSPVTRASSLSFSGDIVLYTTRLAGDLAGAPVDYTPQHPPSKLASDVTFTDVVTDQPYASANALTSTGLELSEG